MLIGGELVESESGRWDDSINPASEIVIGQSPAGTAGDVERAVAAAQVAWPVWAAAGPGARAGVLRALAAKLAERADDLIKAEVMDSGNTVTSTRGDIRLSIDALHYFAGAAFELKGQTLPDAAGMLHYTLREPYGIVARIVAFNHPLMFSIARTAGALAAGNAVIVKPPETCPLSVLLLGEIIREVVPAGVFNIVTGTGAEVGDALVRHPSIKRIAFIGSVATGRRIQMSAAQSGVKHVTLELGGKNPMIVFPDCDVAKAAVAAVRGASFHWQGQSCGSTSRVMVHDSIYDEMVERMLEDVSRIRLGDPLDPKTVMGPINSLSHLAKLNDYVEAAQREGAELLAGGYRPRGAAFERGFWLEPTVFGGVTQDMRLAREETFGPIVSLMRWRDAEEAVRIANDSQYGLAASIWTSDLNAALRMSQRVEAGYVWVNTVSGHYQGVPFGGQKASGVGREEGLEEVFSYTEEKSINIALG